MTLEVSDREFQAIYDWIRSHTDPSPSRSRAELSSMLYQNYCENTSHPIPQNEWGLAMIEAGFPSFRFQGLRKRMLVLV